jgi:LmbE family N-acetylglucosaminyl deacetylase
MTPGGLIVITSHPDDEVLIAGGALAACSKRGIGTGVLCLTRGEAGPIADPALATRDTLPEVRVGELTAACRELGVGWLKCGRWPDGSLRWSDAGAIVGQLKGLLAERRPDAVITFGPEGLYYHPDHIATYELALEAASQLPRPPDVYCSAWPAELMRELTEALEARALPADLWGLHPGQFGVRAQDQVSALELDVRRHAGRKLDALRCHRTQLGPGHAFAVLPDDLVERFLGFERYVPLLGESGRGWLERELGATRPHA